VAILDQVRFDELKAANQLPSPTGVALAIVRLMRQDGTTIHEIARVLQTDPALTGRILKMANSVGMGTARPIAAVQEAVVRMGTRLVRQLALGFSVLSNSRTGVCKEFDYAAFWSRSLAAAVASQAVSRRFKRIAADEAFTCGLLSGIGSLGLASIYPEEYSEILRSCRNDSTDELIKKERLRFATDQTELGAALLHDWGLPEVCVEAVRNYRQLDTSGLHESSRTFAICAVLKLAEQLAAICVADDSNREQLLGDLFESAERLSIAKSDLIPLCDEVVKEWREWGATLEVSTCDVPPFAELAERLSQVDSPATAPSPASRTDTEFPLDILAIVPDADELNRLSHLLNAAGHRVRMSQNCDDGLRIILQTRPDLVVLDWGLPNQTGTQLCRTLRETETGRNIYALVLLDVGQEAQATEAFAAGASDWVSRPIRPETLAGRIRACQRLAELQKEHARDKEELRHCLAQLAVANRQLQRAALTDTLTNLPNRRYMIDRLKQEWAGASRHGRELACIVLDLDHFKSVNDRYGHDVGDVVLLTTASVLRAAARRNDVVCRLAGEEFVVICPDSDLEAAAKGGERLRKAVEGAVIDVAGVKLAVTLSVGVAVRTPSTVDPDALLKAADSALYDAKRSGRNRVCVATPLPHRTKPTLQCTAV
jgi:diguanylate cyclase (GGDEF)-like protein